MVTSASTGRTTEMPVVKILQSSLGEGNTGANLTERVKNDTKCQLKTEGKGILISLMVTGVNVPDTTQVENMLSTWLFSFHHQRKKRQGTFVPIRVMIQPTYVEPSHWKGLRTTYSAGEKKKRR